MAIQRENAGLLYIACTRVKSVANSEVRLADEIHELHDDDTVKLARRGPNKT